MDMDVLVLADMYRYVAILLLSHTTAFSNAKTIDILRLLGSSTPSIEKNRFIAENILAFSPTRRGRDGHMEWNAQRNRTHQLGEF